MGGVAALVSVIHAGSRSRAAAWQLDEEVGVTGVKETPQDREAFAGMRVMRIPDNDDDTDLGIWREIKALSGSLNLRHLLSVFIIGIVAVATLERIKRLLLGSVLRV
ncbi:hypothetical protein [Mesorhizobium sp. M0323]|uniref:hypothetical protein n=1 Tax=Mesorhizobium sp. M0323 TaxID=2956938 RepID=UPI00333ABFA9